MSFVYWVFEDTDRFVFPHDSGYVGVSEDPEKRWREVRIAKKAPKARLVVLYEGTREECLRRERRWRPHPRIGWNIYRGGGAPKPKTHNRRPLRLGFNFINRRWDKPIKGVWRGKR
jgi:hypothetical protein